MVHSNGQNALPATSGLPTLGGIPPTIFQIVDYKDLTCDIAAS
jgi:hypothetical protein